MKTALTCTFIPLLFSSFDLTSYSSELRKRYTPSLLLMCLEAISEGFLFAWERPKRSLYETIVSSKAVPVDLNMNLYQNLIIALLIVNVCIRFYGIKEPTRQEMCNFSFKMFKMRLSIFWKCLKTTWNLPEQPVELTQK